jgi:hypothetical protein
MVRQAQFFTLISASSECSRKTDPNGNSTTLAFWRKSIGEPDAIFQGLKRPGQEEGLAYSVRLTHDPDDDAAQHTPPRFGYVFITFARHGIGGFVVFDWEWREEDTDAPGHPTGWQSDFERRTWLKT